MLNAELLCKEASYLELATLRKPTLQGEECLGTFLIVSAFDYFNIPV